jgi:HAD superfamily hydrolase (TIGR01509 family)
MRPLQLMNDSKKADLGVRSQSITAVIFDADGTVVDTESPGLDVLHRFAEDKGVQMGRATFHRRFRGHPVDSVVDWIAHTSGAQTTDKLAEWITQIRAEQADRFRQDLKAISGARELLEQLRLPRCIATNGPRDKVELTLALTGLRKYFGSMVFSAHEIGKFKPDPGLFLHAAAAMGVEPWQCAVVEDSVPGMAAGIAAGMQVFTLHSRDGVSSEMAEHVVFVNSLHDLVGVLTDPS